MAAGLALGPRLRAIADQVPPECRRLADIGTDHGYIPAELLLAGRIDLAVAADIRREPLDHARRTAERWGVQDRVDFRLGDGLAVLSPGEADCVVIAGMGGDAIAAILSAAPWVREDGTCLLLQPMSKAETLRAFLPQGGYRVDGERLAADKGVLYPILTVRGGAMSPASPAQAWGGFLLEEDPLWGLYLQDRLLRLRKAAAGLALARDPSAALRRQELLDVIGGLTGWKEAWERAHRT